MNELVALKGQFEVIAKSGEKYPIDFDDAWQWVGYASKQKGLDMLKANFEEGIDYTSLNLTVKRESFDSTKRLNQKQGRGGDRRSVKYHLTIDCFKAFCMMAGTEWGKQVRKYYLSIEKEFALTMPQIQERLNQLEATLVEDQGRAIRQYKMLDDRTGRTESAVTKMSHYKPTVEERRLRELKVFLDKTIIHTGYRHDQVGPLDLYWSYRSEVKDGYPEEAFADAVVRLYPQIKAIRSRGHCHTLVGIKINRSAW